MTAFDEATRTQFDLLDRETIAAVPDLHDPDGPARETHAAIAFRRRLEEKRRALIGELRTLPSGDAPLRRFDAVEDSRALLAGTPVEELVAPQASDRRATAERQLHAIETAMGAAEVAIQDANRRVVVRESGGIEPAGRALLADVVSAADTLLGSLLAWQQYLRLLDLRGFELSAGRPGWMQAWAMETAWLAGTDRFSTLQQYVQTRRTTAGLDKDNVREKGM